MDVKELSSKFIKDIDNICLELIECFDLRFKQEVKNLDSPLSRWLDFRLRYIDPQPRQVLLSDQFLKKRMLEHVKQALKKMERAIKQGKDINPYQGRGLTIRNDSSGNNRIARTDLLWADWGIHHLHLSNVPIPASQYFSMPADYLAFCIVFSDVIAFIDILKHPDRSGFSNPDLIKIVQRNWPQYMDKFKMNGLMPGPDSERSQEDIHKLRSAGLNMPVIIGDQAYMGPGFGITSASTPTRVTMVEMSIRRSIKDLAEMIADPNGQFRTPLMNNSSVPLCFSIAPTPTGLSIFEESTRTAFLLPVESLPGKRDTLAEMHDQILPIWARERLVNKSL